MDVAAVQRYLSDLRAHNDRAWFKANQERYEEEVRGPALAFIEEAGAWFEAADVPYQAIVKKVGGSLNKIQRDVRFSNDKTPYHDHITLHFGHRDGTRDHPMPVIGIRITPDEVGVGAGIWQAPTPVLNKIRDGIVADPSGWKAARKGLELDGERLKSAPRGYDAEHPLIDDLRLKSYLAHRPMTRVDLGAFQKAAAPLLRYNDWLAGRLN